MIDYHKEVRAALNSVLPTVHEQQMTAENKPPLISFMEITNIDDVTGDTLGYSRLVFQVRIIAHSIAALQEYAVKTDAAMRPLGFRRIGGRDFTDNQTLPQKIMNYEATGKEDYTQEV